ncbi:MAG TPA: PIN domain-containing protein [Thermomicrobiales bacterium]|nr:PIN domain-containing protein [Thermomicrobiales bacterium]
MRAPAPGRDHRALIDTSAFYALTDDGDRHHEEARAILGRLAAERWRLFTTNFILAETHALILARLGRILAARVLQDIDRGSVTIVRVAAVDERRAREIIAQYQDKDFSLTDATSFAVVERLHIARAFAFDQHFAQYGLTLLRAEDR